MQDDFIAYEKAQKLGHVDKHVSSAEIDDKFFRTPAYVKKVANGVHLVDRETEDFVFDKLSLEYLENIQEYENVDPEIEKIIKNEFDATDIWNPGAGKQFWFPLNVSYRGLIKQHPQKRVLYDGHARKDVAQRYFGTKYVPVVEYSENELRIGTWNRGVEITDENLSIFESIAKEDLIESKGNNGISITLNRDSSKQAAYTFDYKDLWDGINRLRAFESKLVSKGFKIKYLASHEENGYNLVIRPPKVDHKEIIEMAQDKSKRIEKGSLNTFICRVGMTDFPMDILKQMNEQKARRELEKFRKTHRVVYIGRSLDPSNIVGYNRFYREPLYDFRLSGDISSEPLDRVLNGGYPT